MPQKKTDFPPETEKLSETFSNKIEDFEDFEDDLDALEAEFEEEKPALKPPKIEADAIQAEVVNDEFSAFLESLPNDEIVSIIVNRLPDRNFEGQFRLPCDSFGHKDTIYWKYPKTAEEIYSEIQKNFGGGLYQFQIRQGKGFAKGKIWTQIIHDGADLSKAEITLREQKEKAKADEQKRTSESSPVFANETTQPEKKGSHFKEMLQSIKELEELKSFLAPKQEAAPAPNPSLSFDEQLMLRLIDRVKDDDGSFTNKLTDYAFGVFEKKEEKVTFAGVVKEAIQHPEQVKGILSTVVEVVGGFLFTRSAPTAAPANLPMLQQIIPGQSQPAAQGGLSAFKKQHETPPAVPVAETQPEAQEIKIEPVKMASWDD